MGDTTPPTFSWTDLIGPGMALGGGMLRDKIQTGPAQAATKESARQFDIKTQREDQARNALMPVLAKNLGITSPMGGLGSSYAGAGYPAAQQSGGPSTLGKIGK